MRLQICNEKTRQHMNNLLLSSLKTKEIIKANNNYDDEQIYARVWSMEYVALEFKYALNRTAMENIISFD